MGVFADKGVVGTVTGHYRAADGSQGVLIAEEDDVEGPTGTS